LDKKLERFLTFAAVQFKSSVLLEFGVTFLDEWCRGRNKALETKLFHT